MVSGLAGIAIFLGAAASTGAFVRGALKKNNRPTIGSILVPSSNQCVLLGTPLQTIAELYFP